MPFSIVRNKDTHQAHVIMGCETIGSCHADRYALHLLNNLLGGPAMTSRFNVALREKAGLVYTVESLYSTYPDRGLWEVYFGCDPKDVERCCHLVERELLHIIDSPLSASQLRTAQKQYKGQIAISRTHAEHHAVQMAKAFALHGEVVPLQETFRRIDAVTAADIQRVAREYLHPSQLSRLVYK